jgi:hypothetical protein
LVNRHIFKKKLLFLVACFALSSCWYFQSLICPRQHDPFPVQS